MPRFLFSPLSRKSPSRTRSVTFRSVYDESDEEDESNAVFRRPTSASQAMDRSSVLARTSPFRFGMRKFRRWSNSYSEMEEEEREPLSVETQTVFSRITASEKVRTLLASFLNCTEEQEQRQLQRLDQHRHRHKHKQQAESESESIVLEQKQQRHSAQQRFGHISAKSRRVLRLYQGDYLQLLEKEILNYVETGNRNGFTCCKAESFQREHNSSSSSSSSSSSRNSNSNDAEDYVVVSSNPSSAQPQFTDLIALVFTDPFHRLLCHSICKYHEIPVRSTNLSRTTRACILKRVPIQQTCFVPLYEYLQKTTALLQESAAM